MALEETLAALGLGGGDENLVDSGTMTPESVKLRREMALAMLKNSQGTPARSTAQGVSNVLQALMGQYQLNKLDKADAAGKKEADDMLINLFGGGGSSSPFPAGGNDSTRSPGTLKPSAEISSDIAPYANAIASIESAGEKNPYGAIGPKTRSGDRAYGKYQVMGENIPEWTEKHLGKRMDIRSFLADPNAQEKVFAAEFGGYLKQYGNPDDAASMWFTGKPAAQGAGRNDLYTTQPEYLAKFRAALGDAGGGVRTASLAQPVSDAGRQPVMATPAQASAMQKAILLMRNPRTAPIGQALLQRAIADENAPPLIVKVPGADGGEVSMVYDRQTKTLRPLSSMIEGGSGAEMPGAIPQMAPQSPVAPPGGPSVVTSPGVENIGEVGPGPLEMASRQPNAVAGQVSNVDAKADLGAPAAPAIIQDRPVVADSAMPAPINDVPPGVFGWVQWKGKVPEGYVQRQMPDGKFMYGPDRQPVFELKSVADERGKAEGGRQAEKANLGRLSEQVGGAVQILERLPKDFGKEAFERALGPWSASNAQTEDPQGGFWGSGISLNSLGQNIARGVGEGKAAIFGGAAPTEVRDRVEMEVKSLAGIMKGIIRKPGEGAWSDKDQENLENSIGKLSRARSVEEYQRRVNDIKDLVSKVYLMPKTNKPADPRRFDAPMTAEDETTVLERPFSNQTTVPKSTGNPILDAMMARRGY